MAEPIKIRTDPKGWGIRSMEIEMDGEWRSIGGVGNTTFTGRDRHLQQLYNELCDRALTLFLAAPDLLAALRASTASLERIKKMRLDAPAHELAKALYEEIKPTESMARAAIAKAEKA